MSQETTSASVYRCPVTNLTESDVVEKLGRLKISSLASQEVMITMNDSYRMSKKAWMISLIISTTTQSLSRRSDSCSCSHSSWKMA